MSDTSAEITAETAGTTDSAADTKTGSVTVRTPQKTNPVFGFIRKWGWVALLVISVYLVGYYTLFPSRGYFHSDSTDTIMWAVASEESGTLFNPEFTYACLLPFGTSLIMQALMKFFGVTMLTHVLGMFIFFLLLTASFIWMLREMKWSWGWISTAVFTLLMICSNSEKLREIFWGHTIYYSLAVLFIFTGLGLLFRCLHLLEEKEKLQNAVSSKLRTHILITILLLGMWFLLTGMNQIISIATFSLPVMAALFCERWLDHKSKASSKINYQALVLFLLMGAGMVGGYLITAVASKEVVAGYEGAFSNYSGMDTWAEHVIGFPNAWFALLGVTIADGDPLMSVSSVCNMLIVVTGVILLIGPIAALVCYKQIEDRKLRILILTHWFMTLFIMIGYIFGRLSSANWRLSPIVAMSTVITVAMIRWSLGHVELKRIMTLMLIPVMMVCSITAVTIFKMPADNTERSHLYKLAAGLEDHGLNYGYATFWNANGMTIVSDSRVQVRSVDIAENSVTPYYYQGCKSWYDKQPGQEKYFLLLNQPEKDTLTGSDLEARKVNEIEIEGYYVWVFNDNLF